MKPIVLYIHTTYGYQQYADTHLAMSETLKFEATTIPHLTMYMLVLEESAWPQPVKLFTIRHSISLSNFISSYRRGNVVHSTSLLCLAAVTLLSF